MSAQPETPSRPRRWGAWLGSGGAIAVAVGYLGIALSYPFGTLARPGPGFFPTVVGCVLLAGLVALAAGHRRGRPPAPPEVPQETPPAGPRSPLPAVALVLALLGYVLVLPFVGDLVAGAVLSFAVLLLMRQRVWLAALFAVLIAVAAHYLFVVFLALPLTSGSGLW